MRKFLHRNYIVVALVLALVLASIIGLTLSMPSAQAHNLEIDVEIVSDVNDKLRCGKSGTSLALDRFCVLEFKAENTGGLASPVAMRIKGSALDESVIFWSSRDSSGTWDSGSCTDFKRQRVCHQTLDHKRSNTQSSIIKYKLSIYPDEDAAVGDEIRTFFQVSHDGSWHSLLGHRLHLSEAVDGQNDPPPTPTPTPTPIPPMILELPTFNFDDAEYSCLQWTIVHERWESFSSTPRMLKAPADWLEKVDDEVDWDKVKDSQWESFDRCFWFDPETVDENWNDPCESDPRKLGLVVAYHRIEDDVQSEINYAESKDIPYEVVEKGEYRGGSTAGYAVCRR